MKWLASLTCGLLMLMFCASEKTAEKGIAGEKKKEPVLEWTLRYMVRKIPEGAKESLDDAADYNKHQNDFKVEATVSMYIEGFHSIIDGSGAMVKASTEHGIIYFALAPSQVAPRFGVTMLSGVLQQRESEKSRAGTKWLFFPLELKFDQEMKLSGHASAKNDPKKPGQLFNGRAEAWILRVKKVDGDIAKLASKLLLEDQEKEKKKREKEREGKECHAPKR